jgi:hypothetical protein
VFRKALYVWRRSADFKQPNGSKLNVETVLGNLQELFVRMQRTPYQDTTAEKFVQCLQLDPQIQCDVHEFMTLFFDVIERNLAAHPNRDAIMPVIGSRFTVSNSIIIYGNSAFSQGQIRNTMTCRNCKRNINREVDMKALLLTIEGIKTLSAALSKCFSEEE